MLDIKWIRENPEEFDKGQQRRGQPARSAEIINLDKQHRAIQTKLQDLQSERNSVAKSIGTAKQKGEDVAPILERANALKEEIPALEAEEHKLKEKLENILAHLYNHPAPEVPDGVDETTAKEIRKVGTPRSFDFKPKRHFELGEALGLMDFETATKMSGARFVILSGALARLERALAQFMLDTHTIEFDYEETSPPLLVRDEAVFGTGQLPKFAEDLFKTTDNRWLIPTAEVSLTNIVRESIIDEAELPKRFTAFTPCFRSEAGSAGKDTRGMVRQHQFSKVELVSITHPDHGRDELERKTKAAESILQKLDLPYRTMLLSAGDMGVCAHMTYDIEVWLPGEDTYREISSCSFCGEFQARRMNARFRPADGGKPQFVHTLNGSGLAVGRTLIAVLENYQQENGSIQIPEILIPYMNGLKVIEA
jgi:seryl-tRNA synthetase